MRAEVALQHIRELLLGIGPDPYWLMKALLHSMASERLGKGKGEGVRRRSGGKCKQWGRNVQRNGLCISRL